MFDIGMAEVVVVGGMAIALLGKHDMPLVFRLVGRGVGKVSGLVQGGRARMNELSEGSDLLQLQNEIRSNLDDLRVIKSELRGAAQLPSGITGSSHPGSKALREPYGSPPPPPLSGGVPPSSSIAPVVDRGYQQAKGGREIFGHATGASITSSPLAPPFRPPAGLDARPSSQASFGGSYGAPARVGARYGVGEEAGSGAGAGGAATATATPARRTGAAAAAAVKSVLSPGGDRLQQLAMAEIGFAEKALYAPKTDSMPGGADILNDTITDSLLNERYRRVLEAARGARTSDEDDRPSSSSS